MSRKVYFKQGNRLYTPYEVKALAMNKLHLKKVYRSVDEIMDTKLYGRIDVPDMDSFYPYISTKQLRKPKIAKQMQALGLL